MKIFITGGSGFVGRSLINKLISIENIEHIYCLSRNNKILNNKKITKINGDLSDLTWSNSLQDIKIDYMIHLAASTGRSSSSSIKNANIQGTKNIIEICKVNNINNIIYLSSINVKLENIQSYGQSKVVTEKLIQGSNLNYTIFRPTLIYGPDDKYGAITKIVNMLKYTRIMPIFGDGNALEQPIYIDDVVEFIISSLFESTENNIYEIGGESPIKYNTMIDTICRVLNIKPVKIHLPYILIQKILKKIEEKDLVCMISVEQIEHQVKDLIVDNTKASDRFKVYPRSFEQGITFLKNYNY